MRRPGRHGGQVAHYRDYLAGARRHARNAMKAPDIDNADRALVLALAAAIPIITLALVLILARR